MVQVRTRRETENGWIEYGGPSRQQPMGQPAADSADPKRPGFGEFANVPGGVHLTEVSPELPPFVL